MQNRNNPIALNVVESNLFPNKVKRLIVLILVAFVTQTTFGQDLSPSTFNFGKVKLWNNPTALYTFTNTSSKKLLFLPIPYQRNLYIDLPQGYIQPGETRKITAVYYTEDGGNLSVSQALYHSGSQQPIRLRMKGKIISFHPDAITVCPRVGDKQNESIITPGSFTFTAFNRETGIAIEGVDFLLEGGQRRFLLENSRQAMISIDGIPYGYYNLKISKTGYRPYIGSVYIGKHSGAITYSLTPLAEIVTEKEPEKEKRKEGQGFVELEPTKRDDQADIERIRRMTDEQFKGKDIRERDVLVVREQANPDTPVVKRDPPAEIETKTDETSTVETSKEEPDLDASGGLNTEKYALNNVVLLIDVSGSMKINDKLEHLKVSIKEMAKVLRAEDRLTIITYSSKSRVTLSSCPGNETERIYEVIDGLVAKGNSFGAEGMYTAYRYAQENFIHDGNNEIILATDGLFNSKDKTNRDLYEKASDEYRNGVKMSVVGFGKKKDARKFMQTIALNGGGNFIEINSLADANSALLHEVMDNARK